MVVEVGAGPGSRHWTKLGFSLAAAEARWQACRHPQMEAAHGTWAAAGQAAVVETPVAEVRAGLDCRRKHD